MNWTTITDRFRTIRRDPDARYLILAFLLGVIIRFLPNALTEHPIGFDTVRDVALIVEYSTGSLEPIFLIQTPLFILLVSTIHQLTSLDPFTVLRILQPLLYGVMIAAFYWMVRYLTAWSSRWVLLAAVLFGIQTVTLRIGWDLHRHTLSLALLFLTLAAWTRRAQQPHVFATLAFLVVLTHQMATVLLLSIILGHLLPSLLRRDYAQVKDHLLPVLPAILLFLGILLFYTQSIPVITRDLTPVLPAVFTIPEPQSVPFPFVNYLAGEGLVDYQHSYSYIMLDVLTLYVASFLLLLPLVMIGLHHLKISTITLWTSFCTAAAFFPLISPWCAPLLWDRWMLLLVVPYTLFAVQGLQQLPRRWPMVPLKHVLVMLCSILMVLAVLYAVTPSTAPISTYGFFWPSSKYAPASLLRHTAPLEDTSAIVDSLQWLNDYMGDGSCLLARTTFLSWAQLNLDPDKIIINYRNELVEIGRSYATALNYTEIYWIWWENGVGLHWYGQLPPVDFTPIHQTGTIVVYRYISSSRQRSNPSPSSVIER